MLNSRHDVVGLTPPRITGSTRWMLLADTDRPDGHDTSHVDCGALCGAADRSLVPFQRGPAR